MVCLYAVASACSGIGLTTYVILSTVRDTRTDRLEGLRAGADDFLAKPIDPEELAVRLGIAQRILSVHQRLEREIGWLAELASTDELTGLVNRREFQRSFEVNLALASRQMVPLSLVLLDVDHFKSFNDSFGHLAGDTALRAVDQEPEVLGSQDELTVPELLGEFQIAVHRFFD
jgi:PleD family two-component response regulator